MSPVEGEDAFRNLFDHSPQPMWVYDLETLRFLAVNEAAVTQYGWTRAELDAMRITDIRPAEDIPFLLRNIEQTRDVTAQSGVWRHRRRDGRIIKVDVRSRFVHFGGRAARLVSATDVTSREEALDALRASNESYERQYAALVHLTRTGVVPRADAPPMHAITERTARTLGVARVSVWRLTPARDAIVAEDLYELESGRHSAGHELRAELYPGYFRALGASDVIAADDARTDARTREFADSYLAQHGITSMLDTPLFAGSQLEGVLCLEHVGPPRRWTAGERSFAMSVANLISLFIAQQSHERSEERFQLLARATNDAIYDLDLATGSLWWSEGFETLFGFSGDLDDSLDAWVDRVHADDRARVTDSLDGAIARGESNWTDRYRFRRRDGTYAEVVDRGHIMLSPAGGAVRMIGGMTDVTEQRQLEEQLLHSRRLESIGRLAGGIAHDFNNLLTVVLGTMEHVMQTHEIADALHDDLNEVRRAAERAAGLTRQLLAFSRRQVLQPRVVNLNDIVLDTATMLRRLIGENVELVMRPAAELWNVTADAAQFEQVLVNLAVNARDAMTNGGTLTIETANAPGVGDEPDQVVLRIRDTGEGMDDAAREHAFEPFFTTKAPGLGTGLGLATVYGVVRQSGGTIDLESEAGRGTTFTIRLPRTEQQAQASQPNEPDVHAHGAETILLVEDEAPVRRLAERVLRSVGFTVISAADGDEALRILRMSATQVDLLLTDVVMPRMSGTELAQRISNQHPEIATLFMSGYTNDAAVLRGVREGRARFLEKPFTTAQLTNAVRSALDTHAPRKQAALSDAQAAPAGTESGR